MNFQVELTSYCDLTCGYCPNRDMERERHFMNDEVWKTILHKYIVPYKDINSYSPPTFIGHKDGEPLLNKKLPDRLYDLAVFVPDMVIDIYSHGLMLPKWNHRGQDFFEFLSCLPNRVRYMMSHHPKNYDYTVNDYGSTISYLKKVLCNPPKNVEFITVTHQSKWVSEETQENWKKTWEGLPITVHCNTHINPWTGRMEDIATCQYKGCPYSDFGHWFFGVTGNIIACCLDLEEEIILGNVLRDSADEMLTKTQKFYTRQKEILRNVQASPSVNPAALIDHQVCANCFGGKRANKTPELVQLGVPVK